MAARVLAYLSRYTYRVAISDRRLVSFEDGVVRFRYKDRRNGGQDRTMALELAEFVRRFMQHVLPTGFVRIRHYGFLAGSVRKAAIEQVREAIGERPPAPVIPDESPDAGQAGGGERPIAPCPACSGPMVVVERLSPEQVRWLLGGLQEAAVVIQGLLSVPTGKTEPLRWHRVASKPVRIAAPRTAA